MRSCQSLVDILINVAEVGVITFIGFGGGLSIHIMSHFEIYTFPFQLILIVGQTFGIGVIGFLCLLQRWNQIAGTLLYLLPWSTYFPIRTSSYHLFLFERLKLL